MFQDFTYAARMLSKNKAFTLAAMFTLALGIGANTAIFSVVNAVLLRPLEYRDPDRIVTALHGGWYPVAPANFLDWKAQNHVFDPIAAAQAGGATLTGRDLAEQLRAIQVTADLFQVLGVDPLLGRTFHQGEDQPGAAHTVVLSNAFWVRKFGADPNIVGQTLTLNGDGYTVVGVMPPQFHFAPFWVTNAEVFVPLNLAPRANDRGGASLRIFARLKPGVSREQAQAEMDAIQRRIEQQYPGTNKRLDVSIDPLQEKVVGKIRRALLVLLGAVSFVLLIACANVANLFLARSAARKKEMAVRSALGANRLRIIRQLLTESLMLSVLGGGLGLLLAWFGLGLLVNLSPGDLPRLDTIKLDAWVLAFTLGVSVLTGIGFGLAPAILTSKADLNDSLKEGGRGASEGSNRSRARSLLVVAEVALALVLLIGAGLMIRSFQRLQASDAGFDPHNVLTMTVPLAGRKYSDPARRVALFNQLIPQIAALPGVESVSAINHLPLAGDIWTRGLTVDGRPVPAPGDEIGAVYRIARPNYFHTMGIQLLAGRDFTDRDTARSPGVAIVNEALARSVFPNENAIGQHIRVDDGGPNPREIVGIIRNVKQRDWAAQPARELYFPYEQIPDPSYLTLVIRTKHDPLSNVAAVRNEVAKLDSNVPASAIMSMDQAISKNVGQVRFNTLLLKMFAAVALILAAIGIYGVMAYVVSLRTHEIGVRMALGAQASDVSKLVVRQGMWPALAGVASGLVGGWALTRWLQALLFETSALDSVTFTLSAVGLTLVALAACYVPSRRAARIDPLTALRHE
jgi:predicted permease